MQFLDQRVLEITILLLRATIVCLIPVEEEGLRRAYGERYAAYQKRVNRPAPLVY